MAMIRVWEWPLRVWHWLLVLTVSGSLVTGLSGEIAWMDWHLRFGYVAVSLLLFRVVWGFVGGDYSRWRTYRTTPARLLAYVRPLAGRAAVPGAPLDVHTAPGVLLKLLMLLAITAQALTGLATTDDIFVEGPLVRHLNQDLVGAATALHHRVFYLVLAAITVHLATHLVYGVRRDPTPLGMISGRKPLGVSLPDTRERGLVALLLGAGSAALVWAALGYLE